MRQKPALDPEIAEQVRAWVLSKEGQQALEAGEARARELFRPMEDATRIRDRSFLDRPLDAAYRNQRNLRWRVTTAKASAGSTGSG